MRHCAFYDTQHYTSFDCPGEATYVLSRECNNDYYGAAGPCCKVDDLLNYLLTDRADYYAKIKYVLHGDDDTYFRGDQVMRWLAAIENSGISHLPLISNGGPYDAGCDGVWHVKNCEEICTVGWYQPLMMNRAALERLKIPSQSYGLRDTCRSFDVTHDIGVGVYAWLIGAYHVMMPGMFGNDQHKGPLLFKGDDMAEYMVVHYLKHHEREDCKTGSKWPEKDKHSQEVVVGCGDVNHPAPLHAATSEWADMYDAFKYYVQHGKQVSIAIPGQFEWEEMDATVIEAVGNSSKRVFPHYLFPDKSARGGAGGYEKKLLLPRLKQLSGYETTSHYRNNKPTEKWVAFTKEDCKNPGKIG
jgi:hypothetical protein